MYDKIRVISVIAIFIGFFILSIVLFAKRNKIMSKYDVGYFSSFLFTAYMLAPVMAFVSILLSSGSGNSSEVPMTIFLVYPIIGLAIFFFVYRGKSLEYKTGKFFAMLGIGICAAWVFVFKMLKIIHFFESSGSPASKTNPIPNAKTTTDMFRGRINENGEIYDYGGNLLGYINYNGDILYPDGRHYAHKDQFGDVYDANGKYLGRIKDNGEIQDANMMQTGKLNND